MADRRGVTSALIDDILATGIVLFVDQYGEAHVAANGNGSEILKVGTKKFKQWVMLLAMKLSGSVPSPNTISQICQLLEAQALTDNIRQPLDVRVVSLAQQPEEIAYDLGQKAVIINGLGWDITEEPPIAFRRLSHQLPQVTPVTGGDVRQLLKYVNLAERDDKILFLVYLISCFIPGFPHPMLIFYGTQGAGKSTPMRLMKKLIDPSSLEYGLMTPENPMAFAQAANHNAFLFYDNLSDMPSWFSDMLARAVTGSAFSKRQLFTDDDDVIYSFKRTIALNGIHQIVDRSDLLDRSILLRLERIKPEQRKADSVLMSNFEKERPVILGAIFTAVSKAIEAYPDVKLPKSPRMADFTQWGCAIATAIGIDSNEFAMAYSKNIQRQHDQAIEANPLAQIIIELMRTRYKWEGTPADLFKEVQFIAVQLELDKSRAIPKDSANLSKALNLLTVNLEAENIFIYRPPRGKERLLQIVKTADVTDDTDDK